MVFMTLTYCQPVWDGTTPPAPRTSPESSDHGLDGGLGDAGSFGYLRHGVLGGSAHFPDCFVPPPSQILEHLRGFADLLGQLAEVVKARHGDESSGLPGSQNID